MIQALQKTMTETILDFRFGILDWNLNGLGATAVSTISIYQFVDGEYQVKKFRDDEKIESAIFPELNLKVQQIFQARRLNS